MPFQEKSLADVPARTPDVQIFFHGQLLLRAPGEGRTCEVAVNPLASNHVLTIEARTKRVDQPDEIRMRHVGPLLFRPGAGMLIRADPPVGSPAAFKCVKVGTPIDYTSGASNPPDGDFRWILNLEGPQFHQPAELDGPIFSSHHVIRLEGGEYFFRTATRADALMGHTRRGGGKGPVTFRRIGVIASASVFFAADPPNQSVQLEWQAPTVAGSVSLRKEPNTTHEIYINNAPLFLGPPPNAPDELAKFEELRDYYKVLNVPLGRPNTTFELVPTRLGDDTGSPSIPCQVHRLDGPTD